MTMRTAIASTRTATERAKPSILIGRKSPSVNPAKTTIMIAAALVMTVAVRARPSAIARRLAEAAAPRLGHARDEDDFVVHRQAEDDAEDEHRDDREDASRRPGEADQLRAVALLEDEDEGPEGRSHRQEVQEDRLDRDEQRPEPGEEREERAQPTTRTMTRWKCLATMSS